MRRAYRGSLARIFGVGLLLSCCGFCLLASAGWADFAAAQKAYQAKDFATAVKELKPLTGKGEPRACLSYALMLAKGEGVAPDFAEAFVLASLAQERAPESAQKQKAGKFLETLKKKMTPEQLAQGARELEKRRSALGAVPQTMTASAPAQDPAVSAPSAEPSPDESAPYEPTPEDREQYGQALELRKSDPQKSREIMTALAEKGFEKAIVTLGINLSADMYGAPDYPEAIKWLEKGTELGYEDCLTTLTTLDMLGAVGKDDPQTFRWNLRYAETGDVTSQFSVGNDYLYGTRVGEDLNEAYFWLSLAAKNGNTMARDSLARDFHDLSEADREALDQRVAGWNPQPMKYPSNK